MKRSIIQRLNQINRDFYRVTAGEFAATRQVAWLGWQRMLDDIELPIRLVLDLGCGNGRFALFLAAQQTQDFAYYGVDNNADLLAIARGQFAGKPRIQAELIEHDVILAGAPRLRAELVVLFGLIHHVPGFQHRRDLLASAAECVLPGGYLAFAAWRFFEQERFRRRIIPWGDDIKVEKHDYLLDWRRGERALRYCHYVDDDEHARLVEATGLSVVADFRADGAEGDLNRYTVLQRNGAERGSPRSTIGC